MIYWVSGTQVSEFRKMRFELIKTKKILFRNTFFGVQVYEVTDHIFTRNQALQPQVKRIILVQENYNKYLVIKKLFSLYLVGDFILFTLDVRAVITGKEDSTSLVMKSSACSRCSSSYVKENDIKFAVMVASRVLDTGVVNAGFQCRFYIAFDREERVGSKCTSIHASTQSWTVPIRHDNHIGNHVRTQHLLKWAEYEDAKARWKHNSRCEEWNNF